MAIYFLTVAWLCICVFASVRVFWVRVLGRCAMRVGYKKGAWVGLRIKCLTALEMVLELREQRLH